MRSEGEQSTKRINVNILDVDLVGESVRLFTVKKRERLGRLVYKVTKISSSG